MENSDIGLKLNGFYRGQVVKHCYMGKCKVYVPGVYPAAYSRVEEADNLPDAEQITPLFGGSLKGNGVFSYPNLGSVVIVGFWNGDQNYPFFWGSTLGGDQAGVQWPEARCVITEDAIKAGDDARVHKISVDKAQIKFWESGKVQIKVFEDRKYNKGDEQPEVGCQIDISKEGNVNIRASNQIHLEAPDIRVDTDRFTMNSATIKINNGEDVAFKTKNYGLSADFQMETYAKSHKETSAQDYFIICPTVKVDSHEGMFSVISKYHLPFFL